ncbi:Shikimate dehydrogenase [compost metagenome]
MDGEGFVQGMKQQEIDPRGMNALLLGAGGAATAIAAALIEAQVASLTVVNRTYAKAVELARIVEGLFPTARIQAAESTEGKWDLIVNGTSIGLHDDDPLPLPQEHLNPEAIVAEVIMQPAKTKLLITAEARGCRIHLGEHMVQAQLRGFVDYLSLEN